jgi:ABC-type uncharacterized transport system substrate-binding protein
VGGQRFQPVSRLADALLARRPAAFLVGTVLAAKVVQERTRTVPVVMTSVNDPVAADGLKK